MFKQSLSTVVLCLCFGAFSCTDQSGGFFAGATDQGGAPESGGTIGAPDGFSGIPGAGGPGGTGTPGSGSNPTGVEPLNPAGGPNDPPEPVPEPMTMLLFGSGLAGVAYRYRRRKGGAQGEPEQEATPAV